MDKPQTFEKPMGFRDYPPQLTNKKREIEERVHTCFTRWGYQPIVTPTLEFYDTVGKSSAIAEAKIFKCMDRAGNTLVLRPDLTAPIARVVTSVLQTEQPPLRLCYHANVFRAQENEAGRHAEFYQSGVELIGQAGAEADAEVIALAIEALQTCQVPGFRLSVGHVGLMKAWIEERLGTMKPEIIEKLNRYLAQRNMVGFQQLISSLSLDSTVKEELQALLQIQPDSFQYYREKTNSEVVILALDHLCAVWDALRDWDVLSYITFDPTLTGSLDYYTGMTFEGYAASSGFPLLSGGRYDQLLAQFGRSLPATGFALKTDRLMEASLVESASPSRYQIQYPVHLRKEAYQEAKRLRKQGKTVRLQPENVDQVQVVREEGEGVE